MPADTALEDDYIVALLQKDADEHKKRYSTIGKGPLLSTAKRRPDAPKANARFLKNLIRETDSHNAALKAKKEGESRARLRDLKREEGIGGKRKRGEEEGEREESRREGKRRREETGVRCGRWASALGLDGANDGRKPKERKDDRRKERGSEIDMTGADRERGTEGRAEGRGTRPGRWASALGLTSTNDRKPEKESDNSERRERRRSHDAERVDGERSGHRRAPRKEQSDGEATERRQRTSRRGERSRSRELRAAPHHRTEHRRRQPSVLPSTHAAKDEGSDSDPLTELLGPQPPSQTLPRGRGALKSSDMDSRFKDTYNPTTDITTSHNSHDDDEDDWDMALEALKARTKWRTQGGERLRAAGFTDEEIERWENGGVGKGGYSGDGGGGEKDVEDVRWRKRGEGREWDRGKVIDEGDGEGVVEVRAEWAR